jgi:hypothetical protein
MKLRSVMSKILTNKWVLNIVTILAVLNVIGYLIMGNLNAVLYFVIFSMLIRYFSKNMIIVLGIPLFFVNLLVLKQKRVEGMETTTNVSSSLQSADKNEIKQRIDSKKENTPLNKTTSQGLKMSAISEKVASENNAAQSTTGEQQGFEAGRAKNKGYDIDYATTIEDAYDELNNILGSDGIQRLTSDTQNLMKQQMQLAEAMKGMGKLVENIQPMVGQLQQMMGPAGDGNGVGGLSGMMDLAKKFTGAGLPGVSK